MNVNELTKESLAKLFDHTNLKPNADRKAIEKLCEEAKEYGFASVMVNSAHPALCRKLIEQLDTAQLTEFLPKQSTTENERFSPMDRLNEICEKLN